MQNVEFVSWVRRPSYVWVSHWRLEIAKAMMKTKDSGTRNRETNIFNLND
jgi:hypothetical protein